jgi:hypothetical protein
VLIIYLQDMIPEKHKKVTMSSHKLPYLRGFNSFLRIFPRNELKKRQVALGKGYINRRGISSTEA